MRRRRHGRNKEAPELDITAFLNLMVVLVPFLLVSAVFSRVTILELDMPSGAGGGAPDDPTVTVEVVVRMDALEISDGEKVIARFPNLEQAESELVSGETDAAAVSEGEQSMEMELRSTEQVYDLKKLREFLLEIKASYPEKTDSIILMEPDVAYEHLVGVMDAVRGAEVRPEDADPEDPDAVERVELFPDVSLGDAP
ncbi:biopolymer transporter ExbD [Microbulbifer flavimaris]|uniref:Biopolymer transporter ExbD n=1 Tax=Microbulbifer flavimaris TaxID=1781068 RepID=A0ABX4HZI0_9GAMM|nr:MULTISPECIES: biopolymer transporter ExbD [Microbulbifer]KUJ82522.1 biopolymer transporter ExbD [Microbulbifer sp. ZGT114]PCO04729.1 biopolymer transporter ExbD [Microbulbifer flavimaris]